jgi:DNA-binding beta-propeller fold protein YncE
VTIALVPALVAAACGAGSTAAPRREHSPARVVAKIRTGIAPCLAAPVRGSVWVSNNASSDLVRINPTTNGIVGRRIRVGEGPCGLAFATGSVWVDGFGTSRVERVSLRTARVTRRIRVGLSP